MSYLVLSRKWRPKLFADIIGQEHVTNTLSNAIKINKISHAFLFSGPRGVGKTTAARVLAMKVNNIESNYSSIVMDAVDFSDHSNYDLIINCGALSEAILSKYFLSKSTSFCFNSSGDKNFSIFPFQNR